MTRHPIRFAGVLAIAWLLAACSSPADTVWTGSADSDWFNPGNWDNGVPGPGANAIVGAGASIRLTNDTAEMATFTMSGGTLTFTNWDTRLIAQDVILSGGSVRHVANRATATNAFGEWPRDGRVYIECTNFLLAAGVTINVNLLGFQGRPGSGSLPGYGPGAGSTYCGAGHGGRGAQSSSGTAGAPYGQAAAPVEPGSSGGTGNSTAGGAGGGAVRINASGQVTLNGTILANGGDVGGSYSGCGSGGSVFISCRVLYGTNGVIEAKGGNGGAAYVGGGGGGRIAVTYDPAAQADLPIPGVAFSTLPGTVVYDGDVGTLYFSDAQFVSRTNVYRHFGEVQCEAPFSAWSVTNLLITNAWLRLPTGGFALAVDGSLTVKGTDAEKHKLELTDPDLATAGDVIVNKTDLKLHSSGSSGPRLNCGGNLTLTNGAFLYVSSAATNDLGSYGALVSVTGDVCVSSASTIYPYSHAVNGGSVLFRMTNLWVQSGGSINADAKGFRANYTSTNGFGPGGAKNTYGGGGYGGVGGYIDHGGPVAGDPAAPVDPGSAGGGNGSTTYGGRGGGLIRIEASAVVIDGSLSANGGTSSGNPSGGGSGGGIYVKCRTLQGTGGRLSADGGVPSDTRIGRGGGGRIAILYDTLAQSEVPVPDVVFSVSVSGMTWDNTLFGDLGTLYFPDMRFFSETIRHKGQWMVPGLQEFSMNALTVTNGWVRFPQDGFRLAVTNDMVLVGSAARLDIGGNRYRYPSDVYSDMTSAPAVNIGGDLVVTNGARLFIMAAATNTGAAADWGATLAVTGATVIAASSWIHPRSSPTNGGSVFLHTGSLAIESGGGINANVRGFSQVIPNAPGGQGPGVGAAHGGAGHGGVGGTYGSYTGGPVYGSSNAPMIAGSAAKNPDLTGEGGGMVRLHTPGTIVLNGAIAASGGAGSYYEGGGSGGGIYITCRSLEGASGALTANGGSGGGRWSYVTGGGGGRIAVWRAYDTFSGSTATLPGSSNAGTGTVVWVDTGPLITNVAATNVAATAAALVGELLGTGIAPVEVYCYWGETDAGENKDGWETNAYMGFREPGVLTNDVTGLANATHYYFRFYATNAYGDNWATPFGDFSTVGGVAVNNAGGATDIAAASATLRGNVTAGNPTPAAYICWGDEDANASATADWDRVESAGTLLGPYSAGISGLLANKTYYYRCFADNGDATGWAPSTTNFTTLPPAMSIGSPVTILEGDAGTADLDLTVTLAAASDIDVAVAFATADGSALGGVDYVTTNGVLTIPAGQTAGTITVKVLGDAEDEYPWEDFVVNLSGAVNATLVASQASSVILDNDDSNQTKVWTGQGNWNSFTNWAPPQPPGPMDDVVILSGSVTLSNPVEVASLLVSNGATLVCTNWTTRLTASNVTIRGTVTLPPAFTDAQMSNRIWFVCTNLLVETGASLNVNARGYKGLSGVTASGYGPGAGSTGADDAGGYGGLGGNRGAGGLTYGSIEAPIDPGSSGGCAGGTAGSGGGAVLIEAGGTVTVNGTVTANGGVSSSQGAGGSGGSVFISCRTFHGADGSVRANGGDSIDARYGRGGGGRIAVVYDPAAQAAAPVPDVVFSAASAGRSQSHLFGDLGTLYFPDMRFLTETVRHSGQWIVPGLTGLTMDRLTLSNSFVRFSQDGFTLVISNDLVISGANAQLELGGNAHDRLDPRAVYSQMAAAPSLQVGGSLVLTNGGALSVASTLTNDTVGPCGAHVSVAGTMQVQSSSWVYVRSHPTNGGSARFSLGALTVDQGGGFSANAAGFICEEGPGTFGRGAGGGSEHSGAGYGGRGGSGSSGVAGGTYGSSNAPADCGSAGGKVWESTLGGNGGGNLRIDVGETATLNGTLAAHGEASRGGGYCGGGSGGSIFLSCTRIAGTGAMAANGGMGGTTYGGGGGGGRIAVWYRLDAGGRHGLSTVVAGGAGTAYGTSEPGTVYWRKLPAPGTLFLVR